MKHTIRHKVRFVLELGCGLALLLTVLLTLVGQQTAARVRADTIRLHILANSDTWEDQLLKIKVRDAVLERLPGILASAETQEQAAAALQKSLPALRNAAVEVLHRAHSPQAARLRLTSAAFAARDYGEFRLPGGDYTALRIELGEGAGRNWFCVLYPALCVAGSSAKYPSMAENALVFGEYRVRFAILDALMGRLPSPGGEGGRASRLTR